MHSEKPPYRKYYKANCYQILYRWSEQKYVNDSHVYCVILSNVKWQQNERKNNKIMYLMCRPTQFFRVFVAEHITQQEESLN